MKIKEYFVIVARLLRSYWRYAIFIRQFIRFERMSAHQGARFTARWADRYPCLDDNTENTGFDRHYLYHPAWAARKLAEIRPKLHTDISSTLHFAAHISAFIPTQFFDFRPADVQLTGLICKAANVLSLPFPDSSIESLSCMHVVEHVGLGRYGDPLDPDGDLKAIRELVRVLAVDGHLYFVVPVGQPRVMFNAHRIYAYEQIVAAFSTLDLVSFAMIAEHHGEGGLLTDATAEDVRKQTYGCGCFMFTKRQSQ